MAPEVTPPVGVFASEGVELKERGLERGTSEAALGMGAEVTCATTVLGSGMVTTGAGLTAAIACVAGAMAGFATTAAGGGSFFTGAGEGLAWFVTTGSGLRGATGLEAKFPTGTIEVRMVVAIGVTGATCGLVCCRAAVAPSASNWRNTARTASASAGTG